MTSSPIALASSNASEEFSLQYEEGKKKNENLNAEARVGGIAS